MREGNIEVQEGEENEDDGRSLLRRFGLKEEGGAVYQAGESDKLVCNFMPAEIRSGEALYMDGRSIQLHIVEAIIPGGAVCLKVYGDIYDHTNWIKAGDGRVVPLPSKFKTYMHCLIDINRLQREDPAVDEYLVVGTYLDRDGKSHVRDGVVFAGGDDQCLYNNWIMPRGGDKQVFARVASLTTDSTMAVVLLHALGTVFKPALGSAYPHAVLQGGKEVGKTTAISQICRCFGFKKVSGQTQFASPYRCKKTLSNCTWPPFGEEIGRLGQSRRKHLQNQLNDAYNVQGSTHGNRGVVLAVMSPLVMLGQDCPIEDDALLSKLLIYRFRVSVKNPEALRALRQSSEQFPLAEWADFACRHANERNMLHEVDQKVDFLRSRLSNGASLAGAEADRTVWNYATQLVVADALAAFGIDVDVTDFVVSALHEHLDVMTKQGSDTGERFLDGVVHLFTNPSAANRANVAVTNEGILIHVESALKALQRSGRTYDISDAGTLSRRLVERGLAQGGNEFRQRFGKARMRCLFISHETLRHLGHEVLADEFS